MTVLHLFEPVCMLAILAGVNIRAGHHHLRVEVLGITAYKVEETCDKCFGVLVYAQEGLMHTRVYISYSLTCIGDWPLHKKIYTFSQKYTYKMCMYITCK